MFSANTFGMCLPVNKCFQRISIVKRTQYTNYLS